MGRSFRPTPATEGLTGITTATPLSNTVGPADTASADIWGSGLHARGTTEGMGATGKSWNMADTSSSGEGRFVAEVAEGSTAAAPVREAEARVLLPVASGRGADVLVGAGMQPVGQRQAEGLQAEERSGAGAGVVGTAGRAAGGLIGAIQGMIYAGRSSFGQVRWLWWVIMTS